jgi:hypothetical protein
MIFQKDSQNGADWREAADAERASLAEDGQAAFGRRLRKRPSVQRCAVWQRIKIVQRSLLHPAVYSRSNIQYSHLSPCACAMGASVPEMQLMMDTLFAKKAAEVAVVVEEWVDFADG